jgi:hypothetical protein
MYRLKSKKALQFRKASHGFSYEPLANLGLQATQRVDFKSTLYLAVWTGLEPATPCVTGMYSNQLNYQTLCVRCVQIYTAFSDTQTQKTF